MSKDTVTLITGAGSGIGRALAIQLSARGHALMLLGRTESKLAETARLCAADGGVHRCALQVCDVSDPLQVQRAIPVTVAAMGGLHVLVNCAGLAPLEPVSTTSAGMLEMTFAANTFGPAALISSAWPHFVAQRAGCIVNISTTGTRDPFPGFFAYAASKAALDSMTRSCHAEGAALGIRAFSINPGAVETPLLRGLFSHETLPPEKVLDPSDVAALAVECINGQRDHERGHTIHIARS
jgi:NAD(P)-dependent dehydrogenase (short-subunit alcohol dehydrogenase family)